MALPILGLAGLVLAGSAAAAQIRVSSASAAPGELFVFDIAVTGDGQTQDVQADVPFPATQVSVVGLSARNGGSCTQIATPSPRIRMLSSTGSFIPASSTLFCRATLRVQAPAVPNSYPLAPIDTFCSDNVGNPTTCTPSAGTLTVRNFDSADLPIFGDAALSGFDGGFSFGGGVDLAHNVTVFGGTTSIAFTGNADFNAVAFARPGPADLTTTQYHSLRFFVHGGATGGQQLRLYVQRDSETGETLIVDGELDRYIEGGAIVAGAWREVRVPLAAFGVTGGFDRIDIQTDVGEQPVLYLDSLALVGQPTLTVSTVTVPRGATSAQVPVTFLAGTNRPLAGFDFRFSFVRGAGVAFSGAALQTPGPLPGQSPSCGGSAVSSGTGNTLAGIVTSPGPAIGSGTVCTFTLPLDPSAPIGVYPFSLGAPLPVFADASATEVPGTFLPGALVVVDGTAPTLSYTPSPPTQIDLPGGALGATVQETISVQAIGGAGAGAVQLDCGVSGGFTLAGSSSLTLGVGASPASIAVACPLGATAFAGALTCTETDIPGGTTRQRNWPLNCPAGSGATIAAGSVTGNRGGAVAVGLSFIGNGVVHSMAGDVVFDRALLTPTQVAPASGGACFLRPAPNDDRIAFSAPPGPSPLPDEETTYCNVVFLLAGDAPIASTPLTLASTSCLDGANAPVACITLDGSVATSAFDSAPRPGGALSLVALPGQPTVSGSILAINFGGTPINVSGCTPDPATGFTIQPGGAFSVGAINFRTIGVDCSPPAAGLPPRVSDLSCVLQDTDPARVVRYRLLCSTASSVVAVPGASLTGAGAAAGDEVGTAVATTIAPNGDEIMVVGAPFGGADDGGRAFVLVRPAGSSPLGAQAKGALGAYDDFDFEAAHVLSATNAIGDKFGTAVAIDASGDTIAIGAPGGGAGGNGRVFVFERPAGGWDTLDTPDVTIEAPSGPGADNTVPDDFGAQVAFASNGMLVVGAPLADVGAAGTDAGAAYGFAPGASAPSAVMRAPVIETGAAFGAAIASNGTALAIAAPLENSGGNSDQGAVYVMTAPGTPAEPTRRVTAGAGAIGDKFGQSVAYVNRMLVVGAPADNTPSGTDAGSATVFTGDNGSGFAEMMTLTPAGEPMQQAGSSVATNGDVVLLGAPFATVSGRAAQGRVFAFDMPESQTAAPAVTIIDSPAGQVGDRFGAQLAASARRLLIGVPKDDNELGIGGTTVQVDEGRADPFVFDRISRLGFE